MIVPCRNCAQLNAAGAKFCAECGTKLGPAVVAAREMRKTVTVLFADVTGSTALGEQLDPETLRAIMGRYFAMMKAVIEGHGGTVEKFIGDAVMAVFGIPAVHEDDALRAVRAAAEIKTELAALNAELEASRGIAIRFRTGVNTGEVVAGDPATASTLVTGDTINTAARLEQAAPPGEILLGRLTYQLVRDAVEVEEVTPIAAKGKAEPVAAYRLVAVRPGEAGHARRLDAPLVGRERELGRLEQAFRGAVEERSCQLFTLLGTAGVGKSRLVAEFTASVAPEARVLTGRCLSYGEGITYWPIGEIVRAAAGISEIDSPEAARVKVRAILEGERDADVLAARVSAAIGLSSEPAPQEELFWAVRKLLEQIARQQPLVLIVEDIHWAEATLLDLLEHVADWSRDAPLLLLCPARPELLDARPAWGGGKLNATTILLEPLGAEAAGRLVVALPGGSALPAPIVERILTAAEGNPLYVEELLAMLIDEGLLHHASDGTWQADPGIAEVRVPATISALLAARLERLGPAERQVAERASVVGRVFDQDAVIELSDAELKPAVAASLLALVRKELVRPDRSELTAGDAFRFRHILLRDAAYEALPKAERAVLHERFADWLERTAGERLAEVEEIVGHHLGEAHRYRTELGETGHAVERLADRAGKRLAAAGLAAYERGDPRGAILLLTRAIGILDLRSEASLLARLDLVRALGETGPAEGIHALEVVTAAIASATARGDPRLEALARVARLDLVLERGVAVADLSPLDELTAIGRLVETIVDAGVLTAYWGVAALYYWTRGDFASSGEAMERKREHVEAGGSTREIERFKLEIATRSLAGPVHVDRALAETETLVRAPTTSPVGRATALKLVAILLAMQGEFDEARRTIQRSREVFLELGLVSLMADMELDTSWVERLAEAWESELEALGRSSELHRRVGGTGHLRLVASRRALAMARLGRIADARSELVASGGLDATPDYWPMANAATHLALARIHTAEGHLAECMLELDRAEGVLVDIGPLVNVRTETLVEIAVIAGLVGDEERRQRTAAEALGLAEAKGNVVMAARARRELKGVVS